MAGLVQRVPAGLLNILNALSGGENPRQIADDVQGTLDLLQFYGLSQRTILSASNGALAEGTPVAIVMPNNWCVLYGVELNVVKTATMTALVTAMSMIRTSSGSSVAFSDREFQRFGATDTGTVRHAFWAPYPILLPPLSNILGRCDIIGTDATASVGLNAEIGVLG